MTAVELKLIQPEILLSLLVLGILALDFIFGDRLPFDLVFAGVGGIGAVLAVLIPLFGVDAAVFSGTLHVDSFAFFFKILFLLAAALTLIAIYAYLPSGSRIKGEFYSLVLAATLGMMFLASGSELVTIFIGLELLSISAYALTGFLRENSRSGEAALKYFLLGALTTAVFLYGASILYGITGTTNIYDMAIRLMTTQDIAPMAIIAAVFIVAAFCFKIALVPFHIWAPDTYQGAPTPVTAFLAVGSKAAGFAIFLRLFLVVLTALDINWRLFLGVLATGSMIFGNVVAIGQDSVKRMLAYSSIAQAGYVAIGLAAYSGLGVTSILFYLMAYLFMTFGAFLVVIFVAKGGEDDHIDRFSGLAKRAPFMALSMAIFLLSLAGLPPLAGFMGKFYLFASAVYQGYLWLAILGIANSIVSFYYYLRVIKQMYMVKPESETSLRLPLGLTAGVAVTLIATLLIGIYPEPLLEFAFMSILTFCR